MKRLTQAERRAICSALALLGAGEWSADFPDGEPDPFDRDDIDSALAKVQAGIKSRKRAP